MRPRITDRRDGGEAPKRRATAQLATSSARWRSERPPIVFDGEIRHWLRIRLVFTRPYLGTASSMSKTFAVCTYSGGSSSSVWMLDLARLQVRFSLARAVRMSLARLRASIRWSSDLSGAAAEVLTGALHRGGEYIRGRAARKGIRRFRRNSSRPRVEV